MRETIEAHNKLEGYAYSLKTQIEDPEKLADKLSAEDKQTIQTSVTEVLEWMEQVKCCPALLFCRAADS